jgi:hypothetical protein
MPANPSSSNGSEAEPQAETETPAEAEAEPMSRAERRAAARGKTVPSDAPAWTTGKVGGAKGTQSTRRSYSNRRSG